MDHATLPQEGLVRLTQIIGDQRRGIVAVIPVSRSTWYAGVRAGRYPAPKKLGGVSAWDVADIRRLIAEEGK